MQIEDDILTLVAQGDYLDAARLLQSRRDITLDEAAAEIDRLRNDITPLTPGGGPAAPNPITPAIAEAVHAGRKIEAIKLYRLAHGVGLKEAKDAVDAYGTAATASRGPTTSAGPEKRGLLRWLFRG